MKKEFSCGVCGTAFVAYESNRRGALAFCSIDCANTAQRGLRVKSNCNRCGVEFTARLDHGKARRYCSRECFTGDGVHANCLQCGKRYRVRAGRNPFCCSKKCNETYHANERARTCVTCGDSFKALPGRPGQLTCSCKCSGEHFSGKRAHGWRGGRYVDVNGYVVVYLEKGSYRREHRVIVERLLGRPLLRTEIVIHLNGDRADNRSENLFVYSSIGDYRNACFLGIHPKESNLSPLTYMRPNSRGQTVAFQQKAKAGDRLPTPPIARWSDDRVSWIGKRRRRIDLRTKGAPVSATE